MGLAKLTMSLTDKEEEKRIILEDCVTNTAKVFVLLELARKKFDEGDDETAKKYLDMAAQASLVVFAYCGGSFFQDIKNILSKAVNKEDFDEKFEEFIEKHFVEGGKRGKKS